MLDDFLDMLALILTTVVVILVGWLIFQAFGFEAEQRWQFLLFMICFIAMDALLGTLGDRIGFWLFRHGWIDGFWQITLCHAMLDFLSELVDTFTSHGIRTSIFVGTELDNIELAAKTGTDRVELYTEPYASNYAKNREEAVAPFVTAARLAKSLGLGVNAGHDLSLENLRYFSQNIPWLDEVSIGHALICDALYHGLKETIALYKACLQSQS